MRDDRARLRDISVAIDRIEAETAAGPDVFREDPKLQVWVLYHLQVIGEARRSLSESFRLGAETESGHPNRFARSRHGLCDARLPVRLGKRRDAGSQ